MAQRQDKGPPKRRPPLCPPTLKLKNVGDVMSQPMLRLFSGEGDAGTAFRVGDSVECAWFEDEVFYVAVVTGVHEGTYDVLFSDYGNVQKGTPAAWVRPLTPVAVLEALGFVAADVAAEESAALPELGRLCELLQARDCTVGSAVHENVFSGARAVRALLEMGVAGSRAAAVSMGRQLIARGLFEPLACSDFSDSCVALMQLNAEHPEVAACRKRLEMAKVAPVKCATLAELRARHVAEEEEEEEGEGEGSDEEFNPYKDGAELMEEAFWVGAGAVVVHSKDTIARFNREARAREEGKLRELQQLFAEPVPAKRSPRAGPEPSPRRGSVIKVSPRRGSVIDLDFGKRAGASSATSSPVAERKGTLVCGTLKLLRDGKWTVYYAACTDDRLQFAEDKAGLERPALELQLETELTHMPEAAQDAALGRQIRLHTLNGVLVMSGFVPADTYDAWLKSISAAKKALRKKVLESSGKILLLAPRDGSPRVSPRSSGRVAEPACPAALSSGSQSEVVCSECLGFFAADQVSTVDEGHLCRKCAETTKSRAEPAKLLPSRSSGFVLPAAMPKLGQGGARPPPAEPKAYLGIATAKDNWTATRATCVSIRAGESLMVLSSLVDYFVVSTSSEEVGLVPKNKVCAFAPRVDRLAVPTCGRGRGLGSTLRGAVSK